ncbi:small secreted protein [Streptomyces sp. NPDC088733]|uniref:small secreted protein n=1 Tax=Streptomyces sp. NPDC088733 TaxID=3365880 RepID=UPI003816D4A3
MKKKLAAALPATALILATGTLAGCGDNGNEELDTWAKTVCTQAATQVKQINDANTKISNTPSNGKPIEVRRADSSAFQQISDAYRQLAQIVNKAGDPPVDNGAQLRKDAVGDLDSLSTSYANLRRQMDKIPVNDQAKFADGLKGVSDNLAKVSKSGEQALDTLRKGEVGQAMAKQPGCQESGSAPASS